MIINPGHASGRLPHETVKMVLSNKNRMYESNSAISRARAKRIVVRRVYASLRFGSFELYSSFISNVRGTRSIRGTERNQTATIFSAARVTS